tara:strand:- start:4191 stop:4421 length:231 start_codon:yes stop_codon:yes gene_type:complete
MFKLLSSITRKIKRRSHLKKWQYGYVYEKGEKRTRCRLNIKEKRVYFVLWKAGRQGHKNNYWHIMGSGWELSFTKD